MKSGPAWVRPSALWQKSRCVFRNSACETCKGFEGANAIIYQCITAYLYVYLQHSSFQIKLQRGSGAHSCTLDCQPLQQCLANWTPPVQQLRALINSRKRKKTTREPARFYQAVAWDPPPPWLKVLLVSRFTPKKCNIHNKRHAFSEDNASLFRTKGCTRYLTRYQQIAFRTFTTCTSQ